MVYFENVLLNMIDASKYNEKNIKFFRDLEYKKLEDLDSFSVEKICLFGSKKDDCFDLYRMLILLDERNVLWYDFKKNNGDIDKFVLYASMLAYDNSTSIYQQFKDGNIIFIDKKYLAMAEKLSSLFSFKIPSGLVETLFTQIVLSFPYLLKSSDAVLSPYIFNAAFLCDYMLPIFIPASLISLTLFKKSVLERQKAMDHHFSNFDYKTSKIRKNLFLFLYSLSFGNLVLASISNVEKFGNTFTAIEKMIDNPFSDIDDGYLSDDMWSYNQLEEAILGNCKLSDKDKEIYLANLEAVFDDYDYDLEELYYTFSTVKTYDAKCTVFSYNGDGLMMACYCPFSNTIYDFVNLYDHDDIELVNSVKSHEIGHSFGSKGKYAWLNEGLNCVIQNEYFGYNVQYYDEYAVIIKYFCELLGTDVVLDSYYGSDKQAISNKLKSICLDIDVDKFLYSLDYFKFGSAESKELANIMLNCAYSAYMLDYDNDMKLNDGSMLRICSYLDYLTGVTDSYENNGYISSKFKEEIKANPVLVKRP